MFSTMNVYNMDWTLPMGGHLKVALSLLLDRLPALFPSEFGPVPRLPISNGTVEKGRKKVRPKNRGQKKKGSEGET